LIERGAPTDIELRDGNARAHEDLEGASTEGTVALEFPGIEAAKTWYNGPLYREVRKHRFKGATYRVVLVEGA